ncbi:MAG: cytosine deaminase [Hyphomicrobiales bacterium]|nr:cytosine deaminase [Hyphomicrobiales bacterium]
MAAYTWKIPAEDEYVLSGARIPLALADGLTLPVAGDGLLACDMLVEKGRLAAIAPPGAIGGARLNVDCDGGLVLPRLVDLHTHLDKGHIWSRQPNPDGTHWGARTSVMADREANWNAQDLRARMDFALRCAYAHGTGAIRTHIDSLGKQAAITWPLVAEMRELWKGRVDLQAVALFPIDLALTDPEQFRALVAIVAANGGIMGGMTFLGGKPDERSGAALRHIFEAAAANGLDLDFHVDESDSADARSLGEIAGMIEATRFKGRVVAGHCCSLALADEAEAAATVAKVVDSGMAIVSLPMCNMYLMGRTQGRTPRWRGVTLVHEFAAAGAPVSVASDNTRDPFYAYGDLDMIEVYREAVRILQIDHSGPQWPRIVSSTPASVMGLKESGTLRAGDPADLILLRARSFNELVSRPQNDRAVLVNGKSIDTTPPDYRELDAALGAG